MQVSVCNNIVCAVPTNQLYFRVSQTWLWTTAVAVFSVLLTYFQTWQMSLHMFIILYALSAYKSIDKERHLGSGDKQEIVWQRLLCS